MDDRIFKLCRQLQKEFGGDLLIRFAPDEFLIEWKEEFADGNATKRVAAVPFSAIEDAADAVGRLETEFAKLAADVSRSRSSRSKK